MSAFTFKPNSIHGKSKYKMLTTTTSNDSTQNSNYATNFASCSDETRKEKRLSDSQKIDLILAGFETLQTQYEGIKADHEILREECKILRDENKRLKQAILSMSKGSGEDFMRCDDLIREIDELKETVTQGQVELEKYKGLLEEQNRQLTTAVKAQAQASASSQGQGPLPRAAGGCKCNSFCCRILYFFRVKK